MVFGRGGEEAQDLARAGVPFEIVPGISAALGAASYAGIPLTHRDLSSQVVFASGHRVDGGLPPPGGHSGRSLALYMSARALSQNMEALVAAGWPRSTPAALVIAATTADERIVTGTLATLGADAAATSRSELPALVLVGEVLAARPSMEWRSRLPLRGRRVIAAHAGTDPSHAAMALRTIGAEVIELPYLGRAPARWPSRVDLVVLPASSAAVALYTEAPAHVRAAPAVAIDARTEDAARRWGVPRIVRAEVETVEALLDAACSALSSPRVAAPAFSPAGQTEMAP